MRYPDRAMKMPSERRMVQQERGKIQPRVDRRCSQQTSNVQVRQKGQQMKASMLLQMQFIITYTWKFLTLVLKFLMQRKDSSGGVMPLKMENPSFLAQITWKNSRQSFSQRELKLCLRMHSLFVQGNLRDILTMQMQQRMQVENRARIHSQYDSLVATIRQIKQMIEKYLMIT